FGDWHLALAAYNWGEGSVGRAIARNQKAGLPTGYNDLTMPAETRLYVPKLQAVKNIVADPKRFATELPLIENHPYFEMVDISRDIDVALAARFAGVREEDFRELNPSLHRPVILAAGTPQILLPWDNAKAFERNFQAYTQGQYASWTVWTLPSTMSVAEAARTTGMDERDLRSVNSIPPHMRIKAGSALLVPRSATTRADVASKVADNGQIAFTPDVVTRRTTVKAGRRDSVTSIARRYHVTTADVAAWNDVKSHANFAAGSSIVLYLPVRTSSARGATRASPGKRAAGKSVKHSRGGKPSKSKRK
ncbi:MAG: LysM peptidoglycan-binding domain-containing protein, partial [Burkholderiaceae bacterium]|nr:LysM peptidoglycan-binding domain-containing protein [Burkholderiaceae bacterium]